VGDPAEGDIEPLRSRYKLGLELTRPRAFAVERRRGWSESLDSPPYDRDLDLWDERRAPRLTMEKPRPGDENATRLTVQGSYAAFRSGRPSGAETRYTIIERDQRHPLDGVQWADWDAAGRLLVATAEGRLEVRAESWAAAGPAWSIDLSDQGPDPQPPPDIARRWVR